MKIATTTGDFKLYCQNDIERINELNKAGFKYIDLDIIHKQQYIKIIKDKFESKLVCHLKLT